MTTPSLLKSQRRDIAEAIERSGFKLSEFEWTTQEWTYHESTTGGMSYSEPAAPMLVHKATGFYFMIVEVPSEARDWINKGEAFRAQWSPGDEARVQSDEWMNWQAVLSRVDTWLAAVQNELIGPDVWAELAGTPLERVERGGERFTDAELEQLDGRLEGLFTYARATYELNANAANQLKADLEYLKQAARRLSRLDWRNAALGVALGWLVTGLLPPETASAILRHLMQILQAVMATIRLLHP